MAFAVRIWPIEIDPHVPIGEWFSPGYDGSMGADALWRFEPSYWHTVGLIPGYEPVRSIEHVGHEYEMSREQVRALDGSFRQGALPWQQAEFPILDQALARTSPFTRFCVAVYAWERGL